jgi:hypothetical protein
MTKKRLFFNLSLSAFIAFSLSVLMAHANGQALSVWVIFGGIVQAAKDILSFLNKDNADAGKDAGAK